MTAREKILKVLGESESPVAIHQFGINDVSQTAISARLREMARDGLVVGYTVPGKAYKAWSVPHDGQQVLGI